MKENESGKTRKEAEALIAIWARRSREKRKEREAQIRMEVIERQHKRAAYEQEKLLTNNPDEEIFSYE